MGPAIHDFKRSVMVSDPTKWLTDRSLANRHWQDNRIQPCWSGGTMCLIWSAFLQSTD